MNYTIGDFIIRLKNAVLARRRQVMFPYSNISKRVGEVLVKEKFLADLKEETIDGKRMLVGQVAYGKRFPFFNDVKIISRPSLRIHVGNKKINNYTKGVGTVVISTNQGIMTGKEAEKRGLGGEILFKIW